MPRLEYPAGKALHAVFFRDLDRPPNIYKLSGEKQSDLA